MIIEDKVKLIMLYDIYKKTLSQKQSDVFCMYYLEDLSLAEIADSQGITRAAVLQHIQSSVKKISELENAIGFAKFKNNLFDVFKENNIVKNKITEIWEEN